MKNIDAEYYLKIQTSSINEMNNMFYFYWKEKNEDYFMECCISSS